MLAKIKSFFKITTIALSVAIFISNIVVMALLLMSMLAWTVPPSKTSIFSFLGLGFPIIFIINICYLIFWIIFRRWKFVLVNIIVFVLCWKPILTYYPIHFKTKDVPENCIKVLSYNVRSFNWLEGEEARQNPIFDYIREQNADIICLQEFNASKSKKGKLISEAEIKKKLKNYPYHSITRFGSGGIAYGVACYSKYPIKKTERLKFFQSSFNGSVAYHLDVKGKKVLLINNHLESNKITAADKQLYHNLSVSKDAETFNEVTHNIKERMGTAYAKREKQADYIAGYIRSNKLDATIVCGDFNDTPISYTYNTIKGYMTDAYAATGLGQGITYHENKFWFRIDYIMHSDEMKSYNCTVGNVKYSDHYPIMTYLQFKDDVE
ncbi:endonuclease/exonuclease/phosphatase family protein [Dysgonomonas massiliensis]|uniref:endonuclease/exonuclease/phosphatase family protein n=1 Tax=Dysgonomonas massiliensis TaxID=2040292 RepID=UPI000C76428F|nr:endonuclease/exonuclease/phosphatase family protein [Dysgonomonas massiliensis]